MSNKILVTGANGNVGKHTLEALKSKGAQVVAGMNSGTVTGVESVTIDYANVASLKKAMQGINTVFMVLPNHPDMVQWGKNIINAAKSAGVSHIVRSSGSLAKVNSSLKIIELLAATDQDLMTSGIDYTITSPQFFMQNFINFFADDYKNGTIYQPASDGKIGWLDLRDLGEVNGTILNNPEKYKGQNLTITGSENLSYAQAVQQMNEVLGKNAEYVAIPDEAAVNAMTGLQFPPFIIDLMISLNHTIVQGIAEEVTSTVESITGKKPVLFKQFVEDNKAVWL